MQKTYTITINTPIEKAFAAVDEEEKIQKWMGGSLKTTYLNLKDPSNPVGTKYRQKIKGVIDMEGEVISYQRPFQLGIGQKVGPLKGTIFYKFEAVGEKKTRLACELEIFDAIAPHKLLLAALFPLYEKLLKKHLKSLKKLAEHA